MLVFNMKVEEEEKVNKLEKVTQEDPESDSIIVFTNVTLTKPQTRIDK